ncbi:MAG: hypothetical protein NXI28_07440 [bacterium]|nr:hypothetical protein [bacterium]
MTDKELFDENFSYYFKEAANCSVSTSTYKGYYAIGSSEVASDLMCHWFAF